MPRSNRTFSLLLALTLALTTFGCSNNKHTFVSTVHRPTTVSLLDTNQNQSVWEMDIPVNHHLELALDNSNSTLAESGAPSWADWRLYRSDNQPVNVGGKHKGTLVRSDRIDLTGTQVRIGVHIRPAPEMPGSLSAAPVPVMDTPESVAAEAAAEAKAQSKAAESETTDQVIEEAEQAVEEAAESMDETDKAVK